MAGSSKGEKKRREIAAAHGRAEPLLARSDSVEARYIGYGARPPHVEWPRKARLALNIAVNYEAGGERSVAFGDASSETYGEFPSYGAAPKRDLAMESLFQYETRAGIWRLLRLFAERRVKVTFFATARTLEINPEATAEIVRQGHEVCSHGFRWVEHFTLSRGEEQEQIRAAVASIRKTTGRRPLGWYCREPSENTVELLAEEGGFLYDSDAYDDDYPYYVDVRGKKFLIVPYTPDINDFHYLASRFSGSEDFFHYMKDSFDQLYGEALENPKMMNVGVHVRISGRPGRTVALDRFLQYVEGFPDVWVARRVDIARWWLRHIKP